LNSNTGTVDLSPYEVHSRREILALLRAIKDAKQLVSLLVDGGADAVVTSILDIDEAGNMVVVDSAPSGQLNQRIIASSNISFETVLDRIRILFATDAIIPCTFNGQPAFRFAVPQTLVRLQRREFYRVPTPVANPVRCVIRMPDENGDDTVTVTTALYNISAGGVALIDEKRLLDNAIGRVYPECRIDLPGGMPITATLEVRNYQDFTLANGRLIRRIGCMFVNLPAALEAAVQRYITKLEREQNARATGLR
jgi:c-di-GMP-binding flagellar brake protein YcgR